MTSRITTSATDGSTTLSIHAGSLSPSFGLWACIKQFLQQCWAVLSAGSHQSQEGQYSVTRPTNGEAYVTNVGVL